MELLGREIKAGILKLPVSSIIWVICHGLLPICALLLFSGSFCLTVQAARETYPIVHDITMSNASAYIALEEDSASYEVVPGDCLWAIAERFWGDGSRYVEIVNANQEIIEDPNLIYPGTLLRIGQTGYIKRDKNSGVEWPQYSFATPDTWTLGYLEEGEQSANFVLSGDGLCHMACLIQDKEEETAQTVQDWEACSRLIEDYAHAQYTAAVSDLAFEHYRTGSDELYLYSYVYEADLTEFGIGERAKINVCAGLKLTENIQAQFIGFAYDYDIHGAVRYAAADFHEPAGNTKYSSVNGSNMSIDPVYEWELAGMFNPFPWVESFVDEVFRRLTDTPPKDWDAKDELLDGMHGFKGRE
ncbi:MAG: LysM peptidoglycan-binding domain-containing protein [Clostridium sp.]|nr:LysM peptidoglycan-binding domain-containing protein [Clostridium sp.]